MSTTSPSVSFMSYALKGNDSFCSTESLSSTNSDKFVGVIKVEPQVEGVCSGKGNGIVTGTKLSSFSSSCWLDRLLALPNSFYASIKKAKKFIYLKSFGIKCTSGIRSLRAILENIWEVKESRFENTLWRLVSVSKKEKLICLKSMLNSLVSCSWEGFSPILLGFLGSFQLFESEIKQTFKKKKKKWYYLLSSLRVWFKG